jgi:hypothetical protein
MTALTPKRSEKPMPNVVACAPIRRSIVVNVPRTRAFEVFTVRFDAWWPRNRSIGASALQRAIVEPRVGGRWYEIGVDGAETDWGDVLVWEPPTRVVLAWRVRADWKFDPQLLTEVEVTFTAEGPGMTRVDLEHRGLERMGDGAQIARAIYDSPRGWNSLLALYVAAVEPDRRSRELEAALAYAREEHCGRGLDPAAFFTPSVVPDGELKNSRTDG